MNATNKRGIIKRLNKEPDTEIIAIIVFLMRQRNISLKEIGIADSMLEKWASPISF